MLNRPGRLHYLKEYAGIEPEIRDQIIEDILENKKHKDSLLKTLSILGNYSIDILLHLIQEMNMYDETPEEAIKHLNINIEDCSYDVEYYGSKGELIGKGSTSDHPLSEAFLDLAILNNIDSPPKWEEINESLEDLEIESFPTGDIKMTCPDGRFIIFKRSHSYKYAF